MNLSLPVILSAAKNFRPVGKRGRSFAAFRVTMGGKA